MANLKISPTAWVLIGAGIFLILWWKGIIKTKWLHGDFSK